MAQTLLERLQKIFREDLDLTDRTPHKEDDLRQDFGMDENDFDVLGTSLRVEFDIIDLEDEAVLAFRTFGDVFAYLERTIELDKE